MAESAFYAGDIEGQIKGLADHIGTLNNTMPIIKYRDTVAGNTDANGFRAICPMGDIVPIFAVPSAANHRYEFFYANNYWYVYAMTDAGTKLANTSIAFRLYYLDKTNIPATT